MYFLRIAAMWIESSLLRNHAQCLIYCIILIKDADLFLLSFKAYEALHTMYEASEAEKTAALQRVSHLQRQRTRLHDYVTNKGVQLPPSLSADS